MYLFSVNRFKVTEGSSCKSDQIGESGEAESMHSDSDSGEAADNDPPPASGPEEDRAEGRNFLALLQLAPRTADTATPTAGTPTSASASPVPSQTAIPVVEPKIVAAPVTQTVTAKVQVSKFTYEKIFLSVIYNGT